MSHVSVANKWLILLSIIRSALVACHYDSKDSSLFDIPKCCVSNFENIKLRAYIHMNIFNPREDLEEDVL